MSDHIEHPEHYTHCRAEVIDLLEDLGIAGAYCRGNVIKYLFRCDHKGQREDDIRRAAWYAQRLVEIEERAAEEELDSVTVADNSTGIPYSTTAGGSYVIAADNSTGIPYSTTAGGSYVIAAEDAPELMRIERVDPDDPDDAEWEEANEELLCHVGELQDTIREMREVLRGFVGQCDWLQPFRYPGNAVHDRIASLVRRAREVLIESEAKQ